jgi:lactoylglutathione lyase
VKLIHTCYRITDPERSVTFYEALGFEKRRELPIREEAVNYFLGIPGEDEPELELTYNFETPDGGYELGTGYGHIALTVGDLDATLAALAEKGIDPERPPYSVREGGSRICFVRDPTATGWNSSRSSSRATSAAPVDVLVVKLLMGGSLAIGGQGD